MYKMFLDDERFPPHHQEKDFIIVRSYDEAFECVMNNGVPSYISFDHDLGEGKNGHEFAIAMVNHMIIKQISFPNDFDFYVHSQNPIGRENINKFMQNAIKYIGRD